MKHTNLLSKLTLLVLITKDLYTLICKLKFYNDDMFSSFFLFCIQTGKKRLYETKRKIFSKFY